MPSYEKHAHISRIGLTKLVEGATHSEVSKTLENNKGLKTAFGLGVTALSNSASIAGGIKGVGVMVGVSVTEGVSVMVGESVMVGDNVMLGTGLMVGVNEAVGDGGK